MAYRPPIQATSLLGGLRCSRSALTPIAESSSRSMLHRVSATGTVISRSIASSPFRHGIFSRSPSTSTSSAPTSITGTPIPTPDDLPPTAFQSQIAELETAASTSPESLDAQLALLRALGQGGEHKGLTGWYEHVALGGLDGAGEVESKALLGSEEAWGMYMAALAQSGRLGEVAARVRRRDQLLRGSAASEAVPVTPTPSLATPAASASASTALSPAATPTPETPAPAPARSFLSRLLSPKSTDTAQPAPAATGVTPSVRGGNGAAAGSNVGAGTPLSPLYVQIAPATPQANAGKAFRWLLGMAFWAFLILTVLSLVAENTGLLKAGSQPMEFEPEEGKVVTFDDVHGCEEAKGVRRSFLRTLSNSGARSQNMLEG